MFSFKLPEVAEAMADDKLSSLADAEPAADLVVGSDGSCLLHLRARAEHEGNPVETQHLAEVLAEALT
jgi:L-lactate dehydrogenase complex protein LldE